MKLELPLAAVLLASGCLLKASQWRPSKFTAEPPTGSLFETRNTSNVAPDSNLNRFSYHFLSQPNQADFFPGSVQNAGYQGDAKPPFGHAQVGAQLPVKYAKDDSRQLLLESARLLFESVPISTEARLTMRLFDHETIVYGRYFQQGRGSKRSRMEFRVGDESEPAMMTQICDGRFYYTITQTANQYRLEHANLETVSEANRSGKPLLNSPTDLMANGGVASALRNLLATFDFESPEPIELGGVPMVSLRGVWKSDALQHLLKDWVDPAAFQESTIDWNRLPKHIPHAVEVS